MPVVPGPCCPLHRSPMRAGRLAVGLTPLRVCYPVRCSERSEQEQDELQQLLTQLKI